MRTRALQQNVPYSMPSSKSSFDYILQIWDATGRRITGSRSAVRGPHDHKGKQGMRRTSLVRLGWRCYHIIAGGLMLLILKAIAGIRYRARRECACVDRLYWRWEALES